MKKSYEADLRQAQKSVAQRYLMNAVHQDNTAVWLKIWLTKELM